MNKSFIISMLIAGAGLAVGRVLGLVRDLVLSANFGVSSQADAAVVLLTLPDVLVSLLVAGGLSAALIPAYHRLNVQHEARSGALFIQASIAFALAALLIALLLTIGADGLLSLLAPGLEGPARFQALALLPLTLFLLPLSVLAGVSASYLNAQDRFGVTQLNTAIFNGVVVVALLTVARGEAALVWLAAAMIIAGLVRWGANLIAIGRIELAGDLFAPWHLHRELLGHFMRAALAAGVLYIFPVAVRSLASAQGDPGALAATAYAMKLADFALGITVTVMGLVLFPRLSRAAEDIAAFRRLLLMGLGAAVLMAGVIVAVTIPGSDLIVGLTFGWLAGMDAQGQAEVARVLGLYVVSLPALALVQVLTHGCNARKHTGAPLLAVLAGLAVFLGLNAQGVMLFTALATSYLVIAGILGLRLAVDLK